MKQLKFGYDKAAQLLSIKLKDHKIDNPDYKYGAYSIEAWGYIAVVMRQMGLNLGDDYDNAWFNKVSEFNDKLKELKLIFIEW